MARYRKRPVEISAIRWTGENVEEVAAMTDGSINVVYDSAGRAFLIQTLEGQMRCSMGDWLIRGVEGEFYPCQHSIFQKTYVPVNVLDPA